MAGSTYLDHAASSPMVAEAARAMAGLLERPGNPSSLHASGRAARRALEDARESLAADLGARPAEVVLTSGGTEANNLAIIGAALAAKAAGRPMHVVTTAIEHKASLAAAHAVCRLGGRETILPVDARGLVDLDALDAVLAEGPAVVSVMWVNNETGVVQPMAEIGARCRAAGVPLHTDAVQAFGKIPVDLEGSGLDLLSVSAHKLGGPVGIGALVVRRGVTVAPAGFGGGQEARLRSGTVPVALAAGFAAASRVAAGRRAAEAERLAGLRDRLIEGTLATVVDTRANTEAPCSPAIVNLTFAGVRADDVLLLLDAAGFDASTGSACTAGVHQPSEVLLAMGRTTADASASLRFSFGPDTTTGAIDALLGVLPGIVARARSAT
ncbi:MAG: cysteine desulfurase [Propionibacteriaceae bacterium]|nr:cysteine desulfurase [Propionibacteriaceae bacterium]